jgi:hypothetical protein
MMVGRTTEPDRRASCLVLAAIAAATFQVARRLSREHWSSVAADLIATALAFSALSWASRRDDLTRPRPRTGLAIALATFLALPLILETGLRTLTGDGEAFELVLLAGMRNVALGTAALARRRGFAHASYLFSGFLTLFCVAIEDHRAAFVPAALYAVVGLWVLMAAHWERVQAHAAVECRHQTPIRVGVLGSACALIVVSAGLVAGVRQELVVLPGFMPTSGGEHHSDPYARQGVGDGDMLVAAKQNPMSFGPVESGTFLESQMPSLYDMLDDRYGEPLTKAQRVGRAIALSGRVSSDPNEKPSESKRSGREFSTVRRKTGTTKNPHGTESDALFYLKGPVPLHLAMERYDAFDGATWFHEADDRSKPELHLDETDDNPWLEFTAAPKNWVADAERHAVKIVNFRSSRFPSPPLLSAVHIDRVNRLNFFGWTNDGVLQMRGRDWIPQFTTIDLANVVVAVAPLRNRRPPYLLPSQNAHWTQLPDVRSVSEAKALGEQWTEGIPPGWSQVEAVVAHLRSEFVLDHEALAAPNCRDVVGHFLGERRGPDYLFASTAAMILRSLGYPTRAVSGFYADSRRYDRRAGQTSVVGDDTHFWMEVGLAPNVWVPLEPTPGYAPPRMGRTYREMAWDLVASLGASLRAHWLLALLGLAALLTAAWRRRSIWDQVACLIWRGRLLLGPRRAVMATIWLLEQRSRLAGCGRPRERTLAQWHGPRIRAICCSSRQSDVRLLDLFDWVLYAPSPTSVCPVPDTEVRQLCRRVIRAASLDAMRRPGAF